jgi:hypothetical protein
VLLDQDGKARGFESFEVAPHGAGVFRVVVGDVLDEFLESPA